MCNSCSIPYKQWAVEHAIISEYLQDRAREGRLTGAPPLVGLGIGGSQNLPLMGGIAGAMGQGYRGRGYRWGMDGGTGARAMAGQGRGHRGSGKTPKNREVGQQVMGGCLKKNQFRIRGSIAYTIYNPNGGVV